MSSPSRLEVLQEQFKVLRPQQTVLLEPDMYLGQDLHLSSIEVARLAGLLRKANRGKALPFHALLERTSGNHDIQVGKLVGFLEEFMES